MNILPPGTNGFDDLAQLLQFKTTGARPPHNNGQLGTYSSLTAAAPNIATSQIGDYFKDATLGSSPATWPAREPRPGATIVRDKQFGVPHIYGDSRAELMFGIGYATAGDRLFFIDVLRHAGEGDLASFAGGSNVSMDESVWANEPYTQQDLMSQVNYGLKHSPYGPLIYSERRTSSMASTPISPRRRTRSSPPQCFPASTSHSASCRSRSRSRT